MDANIRIVCYLKGTIGNGLLFKKSGHLDIETYTYVDWVDNPNN